jgi:thioredoxin-dependent peroxiredoxin
MSIRLGDTAPDFQAETTQGTIHFHDGLVTAGLFFFLIQKTSHRFALLNLATWQNWHLNFSKETVRLLG